MIFQNLKMFSKIKFIEIFMAICIISVGLFYESLSCVATAVLCIYLIIHIRQNRELTLKINLSSISIMLISTFYLISILWATDRGMAVIGFLKILTLPLFMLVLIQQDIVDCLKVIPIVMTFMTVVSALIMFFTHNRYFAPAGRLAGFLQYSNTYALLLLVAVIIATTKENITIYDYISLPILVLGIIMSGSRTVFFLTAISVIILMIFVKNKKIRIILLSATIVAILVGTIYAAATKNFDTLGRFLTTSLRESTFIGRLLYCYDAIPIILHKPFGVGYLGFYYLQQSIQSGLYSVRYIHNDLLQIALDVGLIPMLFFIVAVVKSFIKKSVGLRKRLLILVMFMHFLFDFDLQFTAVFMIFILLLDLNGGKEFKIKIPSATFAVIGCISIYMCIPLSLAAFNKNKTAQAMYPWNTDVNIRILTEEENATEMNTLADKILKQNEYVTVAYSAKASYAFSQGDIQKMMEYKDMAIENAPLSAEEYEDYIYMLMIGRELYLNAGDKYSADLCEMKINMVLEKFNSINEILSSFGKMIDDQPRTQLSEETKRLISLL